MKKSVRVLLTDGGYKHTVGAARSLWQHGYQVDVIGEPRSLARWSRCVSMVAYPQSRFNDEYIDEFSTFLASSDYKILLPIGAHSVELISRHREQLQKLCAIPLPPHRAIELCLDKTATARFATEMGIKTPQTWAYTSLDDLEQHVSELVFPVVVKSKHEIAKWPPFYAHTASQLLDKLAPLYGTTVTNKVDFPIIQQYIDGVGVGFFAVYQHGHCKRVFMHQRIREIPPSGGASCCATSIYQPDLMANGRRLLDALSWHGVAMVEFKRERNTGALYLLEINPKFWGSLQLAMASGVDFPHLDVQVAEGEELAYSEEYQVGLKYHWPLDGEIQHVLERPKAIFSVLVDSIDPRVQSNLTIKDPLPAMYTAYTELRRFVRWVLSRLGLHKTIRRTRQQGLQVALMRTFSENTGIPVIGYSKITPELYVGAQHSWVGKQVLKRIGITGVVNMRSEFDDHQNDLVLSDYCHLPTDEFTAPTIEQLQRGVAFIHSVLDKKGKVYIHCAEGVSRAPTMAAAYLISQGMSLADSVNLLKKSRTFVDILPVQMSRLEEFATEYHLTKA